MTDPQQMLTRLREANKPTPLPLITDAIATIEALVREADPVQRLAARMGATFVPHQQPRRDALGCDWHEAKTDRTEKIKGDFFDRLNVNARYSVCKACGMTGGHTDLCRVIENTCDLCHGTGRDRSNQLWPDHAVCRACKGTGASV